MNDSPKDKRRKRDMHAKAKPNRKRSAADVKRRTKIVFPKPAYRPQVEVPKELEFLIAVRAGLALLRRDLNRKAAT